MVRSTYKLITQRLALLTSFALLLLGAGLANADGSRRVTMNISVNIAPTRAELHQGYNAHLPTACRGLIRGDEIKYCQFNLVRYEAIKDQANSIQLTIAPI